MRFGHNFSLEGPIDLRPTGLNCILQDLFRDTPLDHIWRAKICAKNAYLVYLDLTVHLRYSETFFEHPTRRHIFANTVGRVCKLDLTLRHTSSPFIREGSIIFEDSNSL